MFMYAWQEAVAKHSFLSHVPIKMHVINVFLVHMLQFYSYRRTLNIASIMLNTLWKLHSVENTEQWWDCWKKKHCRKESKSENLSKVWMYLTFLSIMESWINFLPFRCFHSCLFLISSRRVTDLLSKNFFTYGIFLQRKNHTFGKYLHTTTCENHASISILHVLQSISTHYSSLSSEFMLVHGSSLLRVAMSTNDLYCEMVIADFQVSSHHLIYYNCSVEVFKWELSSGEM